MPGSIVRHLLPLEPTTGEWCDECALPSMTLVPVLIYNPATLRLTGRIEVSECLGCGAQRPPRS